MIQLSPSLSISQLDGEAVLLDQRSGQYFGLNIVGTRILSLIQTLGDVELVLDHLLREFEAPEAVLRRDLESFVRTLADKKLLVVET